MSNHHAEKLYVRRRVLERHDTDEDDDDITNVTGSVVDHGHDDDDMSIRTGVDSTFTSSSLLNTGVGGISISDNNSSGSLAPQAKVDVVTPDVVEGISKFDVLLRTKSQSSPMSSPSTSCPYEFYSISAPSFHHVGNNRCQVVCQMHLEEYASDLDVETQMAVIDRVYAMVSSFKCVDVAVHQSDATANMPPRMGKFLLRNGNSEVAEGTDANATETTNDTTKPLFAAHWTELTKEQARSVLRNCLQPAEDAPEHVVESSTVTSTTAAAAISAVTAVNASASATETPTAAAAAPNNGTREANDLPAADKGSTTATVATKTTEAAPTPQPLRPSGPVKLPSKTDESSGLASTEDDDKSTTSSIMAVAAGSGSNANVDDEKKRRRRSSLLRRSVSMTGDVFGDEKKRVAMRNSVLLELQTFDISSHSVDDDDDIRETTTGKTQAQQLLGDEKKVERRSSTMSISDREQAVKMVLDAPTKRSSLIASMPNAGAMMGNMASTSPSPSRAGKPLLERSPSWSQGLDAATQEILTANALDVIFLQPAAQPDDNLVGETTESRRYTLLANHTGNNRLLVMVQLRLSKYMTIKESSALYARRSSGASLADRIRQLCRELVEAVQASYKGRFLLENIQLDSGDTDSYRLMTLEQAAAALECVFESEAAVEEQLNAESSSAMLSASMLVVPSATLSSSSAGTGRTGAIEKPPSSLTQSMPIIPTTFNNPALGGGATSGLVAVGSSATGASRMASGDVHRAAIESLQKRKKRQGVNNKISQMVAINTGNTSLLERSRSAGEALTGGHPSATMQSMPPQPILHGSLSRFGSTGVAIPQLNGSFQHAGGSGGGGTGYSSLDTTPEEAAFLQQQMQQQGQGLQGMTFPANESSMYEWQQAQGGGSWDGSLQQNNQQNQQQQQLVQQMQFSQNNHGLASQQFQQQQHEQQMGVCRRRSTLSEFSQGMIHDMLQRLEASGELYVDNSEGVGVGGSVGAAVGGQPAGMGGGGGGGGGLYNSQPINPGSYNSGVMSGGSFVQNSFSNMTFPQQQSQQQPNYQGSHMFDGAQQQQQQQQQQYRRHG